MKYFVTVFLLATLGLGIYFYSNTGVVPPQKFVLAGHVQVADRLLKNAQANNVTCSIIAKNEADVPIAIKRIINPTFPLDFEVTKEDLLIDSYDGKIKMEVQINSHGSLGVLKSGDIFGSGAQEYSSGSQDILIVADKMIGKPTLTGGRKDNFFRTAAR
ncbi:MAG: hypothetical protein II183_00535 [Elusimicrobiaceae bacterium]|nr:hypothetical protein [Elusimicrobiaceae bacterium]